MKYKNITLPHGGQLIYAKNNRTKSNIIKIEFECGSRCDGELAGLSHFTEHMFFTGTKNMTRADVVKKYFDFVDVNAATSHKFIDFTADIMNDEVKSYFETVSILINESTFEEKEIESERKVINQEITRYADNFSRISASYFDWLIQRQIEYKEMILGSKETIAKIKQSDIRAYVDKYFVANNVRIFITSPMSFSNIKNIVIDFVDNLKLNNDLPFLALVDDKTSDLSFFEIKNNPVIDKNYLYVGFKVKFGFYEDVLRTKLGFILAMVDDLSEGVKKYIREEKNLVYSSSMKPWFNLEDGVIVFSTSLEKENINECVTTLFDYINMIKREGFSQTLFDKTKLMYKRQLAKRESLLSDYTKAIYLLKYLKKIKKDKFFNDIRQNITLEECNTMFNEIFSDTETCMLVYGNATKEDVMKKSEFKKHAKNILTTKKSTKKHKI